MPSYIRLGLEIAKSFIKLFLKILSTLFSAGVDDMTISLGNHFGLGVSGITLHCLDISAGKNQFICDTAVAQAVKGYFREL